MTWTHVTDPCGGWYWYSTRLPNGWSGAVADHSQSSAPAQPARYDYSATCQFWIVCGGQVDSLEEAKRLALLLAMQQGEASMDPTCRSDSQGSVVQP
jgi:hypothetical protein